LINSDSKDLHKDFYKIVLFQINAVLFYFLRIKESFYMGKTILIG